MEKFGRNQLPDSSSSPLFGSIFQAFDNETISDLSSCLYNNSHLINHNQESLQLNHNDFHHSHQNLAQNEIFEHNAILSSSTTSIDSFGRINQQSKSKGSKGNLIQERKKTLSSINAAFDELRVHVPTFPYEKRLSKIDTLQLAIAYIALLRDVLEVDCDPLTYVQKCLRGEINADDADWNTSDLTARLSWINWENLGVHSGKQSNNFGNWRG